MRLIIQLLLPQCRHFSSIATSPIEYRPIVGLEIHAQIAAKSKLFSAASTSSRLPTNSAVNLLDAATPGTLPRLNRRCAEAAVVAALALRCRLNRTSHFDRKHYFYPDLPSGYQITQKFRPIGVGGHLSYYRSSDRESGLRLEKCRVPLVQVQIEQDSGRSVHRDGRSFIDLNRAGIGLLEIVTEPVFSCGADAAAFVRELVGALRSLRVVASRMAEAGLRVDANVSLHAVDSDDGSLGEGTRTELKNLVSLNSLVKAVDYEIRRHRQVVGGGGLVRFETRAYDAERGRTTAMRDKEVVQDYRYVPEPNLPPLRLSDDDDSSCVVIAPLAARLTSFRYPHEILEELTDRLGVSPTMALSLVGQPDLLVFFLRVIAHRLCEGVVPPKLAAHLLITELLAALYDRSADVTDSPVSDEQAAEICALVSRREIANKTAKRLFGFICDGQTYDEQPSAIAARNNWLQINDRVELRRLIDDALSSDADLQGPIRKGHKRAVRKLVRLVRESSDGRANILYVEEIITGMAGNQR